MNLNLWKRDPEFIRNTTCWQVLPPPEQFTKLCPTISEQLRRILVNRGITRLFSHQAQSLAHLSAGEHVVVSTGHSQREKPFVMTSPSSRRFCRTLTRAPYPFPTKALAQDQFRLLNDLCASPGGT